MRHVDINGPNNLWLLVEKRRKNSDCVVVSEKAHVSAECRSDISAEEESVNCISKVARELVIIVIVESHLNQVEVPRNNFILLTSK